jgi:hypothetical protein
MGSEETLCVITTAHPWETIDYITSALLATTISGSVPAYVNCQ